MKNERIIEYKALNAEHFKDLENKINSLINEKDLPTNCYWKPFGSLSSAMVELNGMSFTECTQAMVLVRYDSN